MKRDELNEIYRSLENKMNELRTPFLQLHKGYKHTCGYFSGHYHKNAEGKYIMDYFPIPVISINGICDIEIDLEKISVSAKLRRDKAINYNYTKLNGYKFEAYGVDEYLDDFYIAGNTYDELVENIRESKEKDIGFSFEFSYDVGSQEMFGFVKLLVKEGFYY